MEPILPKWSAMCNQTKVFLIMTVISFAVILLAAEKYESLTLDRAVLFVILTGLMTFVWVWFLTWLCRSGHGTIAWIVVMLPFIQTALLIIFS